MYLNLGTIPFFALTMTLSASMTFHLIEIITGPSSLMGYYAIGPALDVAFNSMLAQYPALRNNMTRSRIYREDVMSCSEGNAETVAGEILEAASSTTRFNMLISAGTTNILNHIF